MIINPDELRDLVIPEGYELRIVKKELVDVEDLREQIAKINASSGAPNFLQYTEKNNNMIII